MWTLALIAAVLPEVYTVDLADAVRRTDQGRAVSAELSRRIDAARADLRSREDALEARRSALAPEAYAREVERLQARAAADQTRLERVQDDLLAPLVTRLETKIETAEAAGKGHVAIYPTLDLSRLAASPACERTKWLADAAVTDEDRPFPRNASCVVRAFVYVDLDAVLAAMPEAAAAARRLDGLKSRYQEELDRKQRHLARLRAEPPPPDKVQARRQEEIAVQTTIEADYAELSRRLEAEERREKDLLRRRVVSHLRRAARAIEGLAFVQARPDQGRVSPSCEQTAWVIERVVRGAPHDALRASCEALK